MGKLGMSYETSPVRMTHVVSSKLVVYGNTGEKRKKINYKFMSCLTTALGLHISQTMLLFDIKQFSINLSLNVVIASRSDVANCKHFLNNR